MFAITKCSWVPLRLNEREVFICNISVFGRTIETNLLFYYTLYGTNFAMYLTMYYYAVLNRTISCSYVGSFLT